MLPELEKYSIYPSVVPANEHAEMIIAPMERAFLLFEGEKYDITVISSDSDEPSYKNPTSFKSLSAVASNGILKFSFTFESEQEHLVLLNKGGKKLWEFKVYSLLPDLYGKLALKGDLHGHSYRSDGACDPSALAGHDREQGYDFFTLSDHNRAYPGDEIDEVYRGVDIDLVRIYGEEVHSPGSSVHIVRVGGNGSVAERYVHNREEYEREIEEYVVRVPDFVPEVYKIRYAKAMWASDNIRGRGGLAIFPHPFWMPSESRTNNVTGELARIFIKSGMFDAYELLGAMSSDNINRSVAMWSDLRAEGIKIPVVGSSDVHVIDKNRDFPNKFTICFAEHHDSDSILQAVRRGLCVAVEALGQGYDRQYRAYGEYRLVSYAQFLLNNYFPKLCRIAEGQGIAMRRYCMGDAPAALVSLHAEQVRVFRLRYFGRLAPALPSEDVIAFENKAREIHLGGPKTKGSIIDIAETTLQI